MSDIVLSILSFIAGNITMFLARRYIQAFPKLTINRYFVDEFQTENQLVLTEMSFNPVAHHYTVLRFKPSHKLFQFQEKTTHNGIFSLHAQCVEKQQELNVSPFFVHSQNVINEEGQKLVFCSSANQTLYIDLWIKSAAFPYFMFRRELIQPPHHKTTD